MSSSSSHSARVLIYDRETSRADELAARLGEAKQDVLVCATTAEAIDQVDRTLFDVVILDLVLRESAAASFLRQLRVLAPQTSVIIYTDDKSFESAKAAIGFGVSGYFEKSVELDQLIEQIERSLDSRSTAMNSGDVSFMKDPKRRFQREIDLVKAAHGFALHDFVAEMIHQLNQPLFAISNFAHACQNFVTLAAADHKDDVLQSLQRISQQTARASDITRDFRQMVEINVGLPEPVNVNQLIRETIELLQVEFRCPGVSTRFELQRDLPEIEANRIVVEQVLVGLLVSGLNAMNHQPPKGRQLVLKTLCTSADQIEIQISNTGKRSRNESHDLERHFRSFHMTGEGGPAMSLAGCRAILGTGRGRIWASPDREPGDTLHVTLPVRQ